MSTDKKENRLWGPTRLALLGYGFATTIGFIHAQAYYGAFGIDILNYVEPIDLLFISLEHIDKVLVVTIFIVPIVLVWVAVGFPALLVVALALLAVLASVVSVVLLAVAVATPLGIGAVINAGRSLANRIEWLREGLHAKRRDRIRRAEKRRQRRRQKAPPVDDLVVEKPLPLAVAYRDAQASSGPLKPVKMDDYITMAKTVIKLVPDAMEILAKKWDKFRKEHAPKWRDVYFEQGSPRRLKPFYALAWTPRLVVIGVLAFFLLHVGWAAWRIGRVDAVQTLPPAAIAEVGEERYTEEPHSEPDQSINSWFSWVSESDAWQATLSWFSDNYAGQAICPAVPMVKCGPKNARRAVYVIPTGNVASMDFSYCVKDQEDSGRSVRVSIRHDARRDARTNTGCLAYLGATGSMQFFADLPSSGNGEGSAGGGGSPEYNKPAVVVLAVPPVVPSVGVEKKGSDRVSGRSTETAGREGRSLGNAKDGGSEGSVRGAVDDQPKALEDDASDAPLYRPTVVVVGASLERTTGDWLAPCEMTLAAWVGPFAEGEHRIGEEAEKADDLRACFGDVRRVEVPGSLDDGDEDKATPLKRWWEGNQKVQEVRRLILVGRADREPIYNEHYFSNFALAQARANWVREQLQELENDQSDTVHVLSIPGGPATTEIDMCDRVVEIHMCLAPAGSLDGGTKGEAADSQDRPEAGDQGEKGA